MTNVLNSENFKNIIDDTEKNSVCLFATVRPICFKNLFKILQDVFINITLKINSDGIRIHDVIWSKTSKVKRGEIGSLFFLTGILGCNTPLILGDNFEKFNCNVETILITLETSDLETINKHITDDSSLYFFIDKDNYNSETNKASIIECYIYDDSVSISDIIINCK